MARRPPSCAGDCVDERCCWCGRTRSSAIEKRLGDLSNDGTKFHKVCFYCVPVAATAGNVRAVRNLLFGNPADRTPAAYVQRLPMKG